VWHGIRRTKGVGVVWSRWHRRWHRQRWRWTRKHRPTLTLKELHQIRSQNNVSYILHISLSIGAYFACLNRVEPCRFKTYIRLLAYCMYMIRSQEYTSYRWLMWGENGVLVAIHIRFEIGTNEVWFVNFAHMDSCHRHFKNLRDTYIHTRARMRTHAHTRARVCQLTVEYETGQN